MNNWENKKEPINTLKNEHLKEGISPIRGGIYNRDELEKEDKDFFNNFEKNAEFVNFSYRERGVKENQMYNSGDSTYMISQCSDKDKFSLAYLDCTGVIVVGKDAISGKNISFMSHQNPEAFLGDESVKLNFKRDLLKDIENLKDRCIPGSIDAIIFGGNKEDINYKISDENFRMGIDNIDQFLRGPYDNYIKSVKFLNFIISQQVGFSPVVMSGLNENFSTDDHQLSVYFDNENRRLYMVRPKQENNKHNQPFIASEVENKLEDIHNGKINFLD